MKIDWYQEMRSLEGDNDDRSEEDVAKVVERWENGDINLATFVDILVGYKSGTGMATAIVTSPVLTKS